MLPQERRRYSGVDYRHPAIFQVAAERGGLFGAQFFPIVAFVPIQVERGACGQPPVAKGGDQQWLVRKREAGALAGRLQQRWQCTGVVAVCRAIVGGGVLRHLHGDGLAAA